MADVTTPRRLLIPPDAPGFYHLISRCVRRSWLCGRDRGKNYQHRRTWLLQRLNLLGRVFALEVHAYAIMSNHFHLVVYSDPNEPDQWSDESVVDRWLTACPATNYRGDPDPIKAEHLRNQWLRDPDRLNTLRQKLGSISVFMKLLKQPIARRANQEDGCTGHFFEQRFYSGALLDENAVVASMAYVDLNPIRAQITDRIEGCRDTSIEYRLNHSSASIEAYIGPVISGLTNARTAPLTVRQYAALLSDICAAEAGLRTTSKVVVWRQRLQVVRRRQRAYGALDSIDHWLRQRGLSPREIALA